MDHLAGKIYWANGVGNKISWARLDGLGGGDFNTGTATVAAPVGIAVDVAAKKIYWANYSGNKISFAKLDNTGGGDLNIIGTTVNAPWGVTISQTLGKVFGATSRPTTSTSRVWTVPVAASWRRRHRTARADARRHRLRHGQGVLVQLVAHRSGRLSNLNGNGGGGTLYPSPGNAQSAMPVILKAPAAKDAPAITTAGTVTPTTLTCAQGTWGEDLIGEFVYRAPRTFAYQWTAGRRRSTVRPPLRWTWAFPATIAAP